MWRDCKIKVKSDVQQGTSAEGRDWQRMDMVVEFDDYDIEGNKLMKQNGEPYKNLVKLDLFGKWVDKVQELGLEVGDSLWCDIRIQTETARTQSGRSYVRNNIYLADIRQK